MDFECQACHGTIPLAEFFSRSTCPANPTGHAIAEQSLLGAVKQQGVAWRLTAATSTR
jgi:hypothetical protein